MFLTQSSLEKALEKVLGKEDASGLKLQIAKLKEELETLRLQKKMEETEIKHLVKMKEEKLALEMDKNFNTLTKTMNEKEMALQSKYHDRVMNVITAEHAKIQELYKEILSRLPNVNVALNKKV